MARELNDEDELSLGLPTELKRKKEQLDSGPRRSTEKKSAMVSPFLWAVTRPCTWWATWLGMSSRLRWPHSQRPVREACTKRCLQAAPSLGEDTDAEEGDDFELLDQSELDQIESELGLSQDQEAEAQQNKEVCRFPFKSARNTLVWELAYYDRAQTTKKNSNKQKKKKNRIFSNCELYWLL